ncbi:MAG TPA: right-handed parallel beta-helix repeat-containing protein [Pyrinomonadaceae bacterium]|nr:right-handed parallel beta-helix repeat-containing protein [Pyrinomonadaceae bacterium]
MSRETVTILKFLSRATRARSGGVTLKVSPRAARPLALSFFCFLCLIFAATPSRAATFTVNSNTNVSDANPGNGSCQSSNGTGRVCTLRGAIEEVNALAGTHTINFNIAGGTLAAATITVTGTTLPPITRAGVTINGTTQPNNNTGTLGTGGTVGVGAIALPTFNRPDVMIVDGGGFAVGLDVQAANVTLRGLCIYGFGTAANDDGSGNIRVGNVSGVIITQNLIGTPATSFTDPGAGARSIGDNIRVSGGDSGTITNNLIGYSNGKGIQIGNDADNWTITGNEVRGNGINNSNLDGIDIENGSGGATVSANYFWENEACGVDMYASAGGNEVSNNTIRRNGRGTNANLESMGVRVFGTGSTIELNIIESNYGAGVTVTSGASGNQITRNSIFDNGTITNKTGGGPSTQIGIDLIVAGESENVGTSPFVTPNGAATNGGNLLFDFPVITGAVLATGGATLTLNGTCPAGADMEFFIAAPDPRGYGEGQTYLLTLREGSASDLNATAGSFTFRLSTPAGVSVGTTLTATATSTTTLNTSEFSLNAVAVLAPDIELRKCVNWNSACVEGTVNNIPPGTDLTYTLTFRNRVAAGGMSATGLTLIDIIPPNTEFKVGSMTYNRGTTTLGVPPTMQATNVSLPNPDPTQPPLPPPDADPAWSYTPTGTYDPAVKFVRWKFTTGAVASGTSGTVAFTVRIK